MRTEHEANLLVFFKALADSSRLKIVGLLAQQPYTVEQLAEILGLRPSTVSHHLARLAEAGLVTAQAESYYNVYRLEKGLLEKMAAQMLARETFPVITAEVDTEAYNRKVVADFSLPDGRLKVIPAQRKKLEAVLLHIAESFQPGVRYTEKQVNEILARYHPDTATLRRELIGHRLLARSSGGGEYWRVEKDRAHPNTGDY